MEKSGFLDRFRKSGSVAQGATSATGGRQKIFFRLEFPDTGAEMTVVTPYSVNFAAEGIR